MLERSETALFLLLVFMLLANGHLLFSRIEYLESLVELVIEIQLGVERITSLSAVTVAV